MPVIPLIFNLPPQYHHYSLVRVSVLYLSIWSVTIAYTRNSCGISKWTVFSTSHNTYSPPHLIGHHLLPRPQPRNPLSDGLDSIFLKSHSMQRCNCFVMFPKPCTCLLSQFNRHTKPPRSQAITRSKEDKGELQITPPEIGPSTHRDTAMAQQRPVRFGGFSGSRSSEVLPIVPRCAG